jgi:hypothetical protein
MFIVNLDIPIRKGDFLYLIANLEGSQIIWIQNTYLKGITLIGSRLQFQRTFAKS